VDNVKNGETYFKIAFSDTSTTPWRRADDLATDVVACGSMRTASSTVGDN
jgi:hypothetical protein